MLALISTTCFAQDYIKNGRACVAEICLGDGVLELQRIKWSPVDISKIKVDEYSMAALNKRFPEKLPSNLPRYLSVKKFDATSLNDLSKVTVICTDDDNMLSGEYKTSSGNSTEVLIRLLPKSKSDSNLGWQVVHIQRGTSGTAYFTNEEKSSFKSQIEERYKEFNPLEFGAYSKENGLDNVSYQMGGNWMNLRLMDRDFYGKIVHPSQCNKKVNLD